MSTPNYKNRGTKKSVAESISHALGWTSELSHPDPQVSRCRFGLAFYSSALLATCYGSGPGFTRSCSSKTCSVHPSPPSHPPPKFIIPHSCSSNTTWVTAGHSEPVATNRTGRLTASLLQYADHDGRQLQFALSAGMKGVDCRPYAAN